MGVRLRVRMKRMNQLDGVRGIAILLVLLWHYVACQVVAQPRSVMSYCNHALSLTWSGVDLFFVLSGFLITGILLDHRDTLNFFRVFYLRRVCRIFPLYFLLLSLYFCVRATPLFLAPAFQWLFREPFPLWSYVSFTQNVLMGLRGDFGANWLGVTWSLAVEEQFYLFVPLLVYFLPRRVLVCVLVLIVSAAPLLRCASPGFHAYVNMPWRSDSLLSGALLAVAVRWRPFVATVRLHRMILLALFVTMLFGAVVLTVRSSPLGAVSHLWLAGLYSAFVLIAFLDRESWLSWFLGSRLLVLFGQISYGIYMVHQTVSGMLHGAFGHGTPQIRTASDAGLTVVALCLTLVLAILSYRFVESPLLRVGHRFQYVPKSRQDPALNAVPNKD